MPKTAKYIYKRKDGRWEARYPVGKNANGSTKYMSIYGRTYNEVKSLLYQSITFDCNNYSRKKLLFSTLIDSWMQMNSVKQKPSTKLKYEYLIENHIKPYLGGYDIKEIDELLINQFLKEKLSTGRLDHKGDLSNAYVKSMLLIIESALNYGVEQELCKKLKSPINRPSPEKTEINILTEADQLKLENALKTDHSLEKIGILISLNMGLRIGEICALRWKDIDLVNNILHVRHTITRVKNTNPNISAKTILIMDTPKTKTSIRDIPITSKMYNILSIARFSATSDFVVSVSPSFVSPRTFEYRFHKKLKECNMSQINYHALRHTFATRCIEKGVDIKTLSEILGHSSVSITLNTYVHSSMTLKRQQLEKLL